jgi:hypothetical protein
MYITIFGSCRQNSLFDLYTVSNIRENLTYPHYSKEIVQAVEFCKGISNVPSDLTQYAFRTGILENKTLSSIDFKREYEQSDLFVVEIASRICYKYKGVYVHHILTEPEYGFKDIDNIEITNSFDEDIEQDLLRLKELFHPKPFIVSTHIYTYKSGKRYEFVKLLTTLCKKHHIPLFDPYEQTKEHDQSTLYENGSVLHHYNKNGHKIIGKKYADFISLLKTTPQINYNV